MNERAIAFIGSSAAERIDQVITQVVSLWRLQWGLEADVHVECAPAWEIAPPEIEWKTRYAGGHGNMWIGWEMEFPKSLQRQMFAPDPMDGSRVSRIDSIASQTAHAGATALANALATAVVVNATADRVAEGHSVASQFKWASGALIARIAIGDGALWCLLDIAAVRAQHRIPDGCALMPLAAVNLRDALREVPVQLSVTLGYAEVELREVLNLGVSDVIRVQTSIDAAMSVKGPDGHELFKAHLGRSGETVAVEAIAQS